MRIILICIDVGFILADNGATLKKEISMYKIDFAKCKPGQLLRVLGFAQGVNCSYRRMLLAMGIVPQTTVKFIRRAPFGDPVVLAVRGSQLCLRQDELQMLQLEQVSD